MRARDLALSLALLASVATSVALAAGPHARAQSAVSAAGLLAAWAMVASATRGSP